MKIHINFNKKMIWVKKHLLIIFLALNTTTLIHAQTYTSKVKLSSNDYSIDDMIRLDYASLFFVDSDKEEGIMGVIGDSSGGKIEVRIYDYDENKPDGKGIEIYYGYISESSRGSYTIKTLSQMEIPVMTPEGIYESPSIYTAGNDIKRRAQDARIYKPGLCINKTWSELFQSVILGGACTSGIYAKPVQPVVVEVKIIGDAKFTEAKIPAVGILKLNKRGEVFRDNPGKLYSYCENNKGSKLYICDLFNKITKPKTDSSEDIVIAAHRGWWGYDIGTGEPENTLSAVIKASEIKPNSINIVEMDLTTSQDHELIFMHDYVMKRLTNYPGDKFSFQLPWSTMKDYRVRKRNNDLSSEPISRFFDVLFEVKLKQMIMMIDIKEQQSNGKDPNCLANCDFQSLEAQKQSWAKIARQCIRQAESIDAKKNLIFKTYYPPEEIYKLIGNNMNNVLWTPMIVPNNFKNDKGVVDINLMVDFINKWNKNDYKNLVACYETNFFAANDVMLQSFTKNNTNYQNLLHYIHATTGKRSGVFSEEPVNPKGTVNRWGKWKIKNPKNDIRGDFFKLMNIPYGKYMLITTDRSDVWQEIKTKY